MRRMKNRPKKHRMATVKRLSGGRQPIGWRPSTDRAAAAVTYSHRAVVNQRVRPGYSFRQELAPRKPFRKISPLKCSFYSTFYFLCADNAPYIRI